VLFFQQNIIELLCPAENVQSFTEKSVHCDIKPVRFHPQLVRHNLPPAFGGAELLRQQILEGFPDSSVPAVFPVNTLLRQLVL